MKNQIEIYQASDGQTQIEVTFEHDSVWLTQKMMADLFQTTVPNINMHIKNVFDEGELSEEVTIKDFLIVRTEGQRAVKRSQKFYNLDVIISIGYRIKSQVATIFRQWATQRLKDYLIQGYAINEKRLAQKQQELQTLKDGIRILSRAMDGKIAEKGLEWLQQFATGLELLDDYDHEQLDNKGLTKRPAVYPETHDYKQVIDMMKANFESAVFGKEKDGSFKSAIAQIVLPVVFGKKRVVICER